MRPHELADADCVEQAFRELHARARVAASTDVSEILLRARRRRAGHALVVAVAVMVMIATGFALAGSPRPAHQPVNPPVTASVAPPSPAGTRGAVTGTIPPGFMLREAQASEVVDGGSMNGPCIGRPSQTRSLRHEFGAEAAQVIVHHSLYLYADEAAARAAFDIVRRNLRGCFGFPDAKVLANDRPAWGDEAAAVTAAMPADGAGEYTGKPLRMVALRVGTALMMAYGYPDATAQVDADARATVSRLCLYDPDCAPRAGLPAPLRSQRDGDNVWVAVLTVVDETNTPAAAGAAIAAAAEVGYRPSIVPVHCDEGAATALGVSGNSARYVAIYFARRTDAEALAAALSQLDVRTLQVRTRCVPS
jgi:hypothetical protein